MLASEGGGVQKIGDRKNTSCSTADTICGMSRKRVETIASSRPIQLRFSISSTRPGIAHSAPTPGKTWNHSSTATMITTWWARLMALRTTVRRMNTGRGIADCLIMAPPATKASPPSEIEALTNPHITSPIATNGRNSFTR